MTENKPADPFKRHNQARLQGLENWYNTLSEKKRERLRPEDIAKGLGVKDKNPETKFQQELEPFPFPFKVRGD